MDGHLKGVALAEEPGVGVALLGGGVGGWGGGELGLKGPRRPLAGRLGSIAKSLVIGRKAKLGW